MAQSQEKRPTQTILSLRTHWIITLKWYVVFLAANP
jgi:hypothetical protein